MDFLKELNLENKKLYIVLNKADVKIKSDLEDIFDVIEENLENYNIPFEGISAYNSLQGCEILYRYQSLFTFLKENDIRGKAHNLLLSKLFCLRRMYEKSILTSQKEINIFQTAIKNISVDFVQLGEENINNHFQYKFNALSQALSALYPLNTKVALERLDNIFKELEDNIASIFHSKTAKKYQNIDPNTIKIHQALYNLTAFSPIDRRILQQRGNSRHSKLLSRTR